LSLEDISGALSGGVSGFAAAGPIGAAVGVLGSVLGGSKRRKARRRRRRAQREAQRLRNIALTTQASRQGEEGARLASGQKAAFGAANVAGATAASAQLDAIFQTYRDQIATLQGVSRNFAGHRARRQVIAQQSQQNRIFQAGSRSAIHTGGTP